MPSLGLVLVNGTLLTQDRRRPRADALAVLDGRIVAVGSREEVESLAGASTRRIDLEGGTLLPGFNDSHVHVWKVGQLLTSILDLRSTGSLGELALALRRRDSELSKGSWLLGRGYNEARMEEGRQPHRLDLDRAVPDRPVALTRTCGHMLVANTRALELAGIDRNTPDPPGGALVRDERGEPTGLFQETAIGLLRGVIPEPTPAEYVEMVAAAHRAQLRRGITSATEAGALPDLLLAYRKLDDDGALKLRMNVMAMRLSEQDGRPLPLPEKRATDFLRIDSVKLFADGGLSGATAALHRRYRHEPGTGILRLSSEEVYSYGRDAQEAGLRVCTHAIGDRAIDAVLEAYERLAEVGGRGHRLEHFGLPDARQIERAVRVGAMAAPQSVFLHALGENFRRYLTEDYLKRTYPLRSMIARGLLVALGSDAPVVPDDSPLLGIETAVTRRTNAGHPIALEESISVSDAIYACTMGGAVLSGDAENRGSLTPGKWGDLVLLDRNPESVPAEEISRIRVVKTFVSGELVHAA